MDESNAPKASYIIVWQLIRGNSYLMYRLVPFFLLKAYMQATEMNANGRHVFFGTNHFWVEKVRKSETNDANFRMSDLYLAGRRLLVQGCLCNNQQSRNATRRMPVVWKLSFFEQDHLCIPGNTGWFKENAWSEGFSNKQPLISAIRLKSRHQKILKPVNRHSEY